MSTVFHGSTSTCLMMHFTCSSRSCAYLLICLRCNPTAATKRRHEAVYRGETAPLSVMWVCFTYDEPASKCNSCWRHDGILAWCTRSRDYKVKGQCSSRRHGKGQVFGELTVYLVIKLRKLGFVGSREFSKLLDFY